MNSNRYIFLSSLSLLLIGIILWGIYAYFSGNGSASNQLIFVHPSALYFLWIIPAFYLLFYAKYQQKLTLLNQYGHPFFGQSIPQWRIISGQFFFAITIAFIITALAQPIYGKKKVQGIAKSMEIAVCLDISNSMNAMDMQGDARLTVAKRTLSGLIAQLSGEKIGLCLFAGDAMVQLPLTSDYQTADLFTNEVQTSYISEQGTNITGALETAALMFSKNSEPKCIILLTDGENHDEEESEIYSYIREHNISFYGIGIGTSTGASIPLDPTDLSKGVKRDENGFTVTSQLNPEFIKTLANKLNGTAIITSEAYPDLNAILTEINRGKIKKSRNLDFEIKSSVYEYAVLLALISFLCWILIRGIRAYG